MERNPCSRGLDAYNLLKSWLRCVYVYVCVCMCVCVCVCVHGLQDADTKPSDKEKNKQQPVINATDRIMLDDEEPISDAVKKGKKERQRSRPEYERTSMAPGIKRNDLPCLTAEELDELEREHDNIHYFDHHESEWSDECLWCSKTWAKLVKLLGERPPQRFPPTASRLYKDVFS
jgi:hypothetical protein